MTIAEDGTRDLLPPIEADPEEIIGTPTLFAGSLTLASELPLAATLPGSAQPAAALPSIEPVGIFQDHGSPGQPAAVPIMGLAASIDAPDVSDAGHVIPALIVEDVPVLEHSSTGYGGGGAGGHDRSGDGSGPNQPLQQSDETHGGAGRAPVGADDMVGEVDDTHSINVRQIAIVDQEASVMVSGYVGEVVARVHIDQDLMMDQDADISFLIDGDGHFTLLLDQDTRIDQDVEIDIEIFDVDGVLYVDVFLRDSIEIEQDTTLDMHIGDGSPGGSVEVNQDIEMDQTVDIDIDIEDELEERYVVKVNVATLQEADVEQDASIDITNLNGHVDMDVNAVQTAVIEQHTIVQADFSLA